MRSEKSQIIYPGSFEPIHSGHVNVIKGVMHHFLKHNQKMTLLVQHDKYRSSDMLSKSFILQRIYNILSKYNLSQVDIEITELSSFYAAYKYLQHQGMISENNVFVVIDVNKLFEIEHWDNFKLLREEVTFIIVHNPYSSYDSNTVIDKSIELKIKNLFLPVSNGEISSLNIRMKILELLDEYN